jgi:hypothetical protein
MPYPSSGNGPCLVGETLPFALCSPTEFAAGSYRLRRNRSVLLLASIAASRMTAVYASVAWPTSPESAPRRPEATWDPHRQRLG